MKILTPVLHYHPVSGGFEIFIKNVCERLGRDHEIYVITGKVKDQPLYEKKNKLEIHRKSSLFELRDYSYSSYWYIFTMIPFLFFSSFKIIKRKKIDIMHAQGFFSGIVCYLLKKITGVPYIITIQSADFTIYHSEIKFNFIIKLQKWFESVIYKNAAVCHAVSDDLCKHFNNQGINKCFMVPNGVETDLFKPINDKRKKEVRENLGIKTKYFVSCLSRLQEKNGTHTVVEAMHVLMQKRTDICCHIIGDGVERLRLEKMIKEYNLENNVFLVGHVLHEEVGEYIAASDVFVRPSIAEGFGIVYLEAMACDVPVVGTPVGGIVDFLKDGETGLMCEVENAKDLALKIEKLIDDNELVKKIVNNSRKMIDEKYSWDSISRDILSLYEKTIK